MTCDIENISLEPQEVADSEYLNFWLSRLATSEHLNATFQGNYIETRHSAHYSVAQFNKRKPSIRCVILIFRAVRRHLHNWHPQDRHLRIATCSHYQPNCSTTAPFVSRSSFSHKPFLSYQVQSPLEMALSSRRSCRRHHISACLPHSSSTLP